MSNQVLTYSALGPSKSEPNDSQNTQRGGLRNFGTGLRAEELFLKKVAHTKEHYMNVQSVLSIDNFPIPFSGIRTLASN